MKEFDAFISHSSEDKKNLVRPLSIALQEYGAKIWYDEFSLKPGVSLSRSIEKGLSNSKYGIVVLSESFFKKSWTEYELRALNSLEVANPGIIIPIWHNVDIEAVREFSLYLSDKLAIVAGGKSIDEICIQILEVIREDLFEEILQKKAWEDIVDKAKIKKLSKKEAKQIKIGPIRHKKFTNDILTRIRLIRIALFDVYTHSFEYWLGGFQRDIHPENEIMFWERTATCYMETLTLIEVNTSEKREEIFALILSVLNGYKKGKNKLKFLTTKEKNIIIKVCTYSVPAYDIKDKEFGEDF
jgi:hypothetical protein